MKATNRTYNDRELKSLRRTLRKNFTDQERLLWSKLRNRQLDGHKFYRQYGVGRYVVDFYCPEKRIVIELDGGHHTEKTNLQLDAERDKALNTLNIRVLRFWNHEVKTNLYGVLETILHILKDS
ncbi:MAG: endonuclease domain-containing protein [Patescibacteria group bacterium]